MIKTCKNILQLSEIVANTLLKINQHFERLVRSTKLLDVSQNVSFVAHPFLLSTAKTNPV